jgi:vitamin B12 transporter
MYERIAVATGHVKSLENPGLALDRRVIRECQRAIAMALGVSALLHGSLSVAQAEAPTPAVEQPALAGSETIVIVEGSHDELSHRGRALREAPFVTIIEERDRRGQLLSVSEAISGTVGASVRSSGGVGGASTLSIRGAGSGHTGVSIDGIPLSRLTSVSADLGRFQLGEFETVEVYRGNVPLELGGAGVGGAVNLTTRLGVGRDGERIRALAGMGSYGTRRVGVHLGDQWRGYDVTASAAYLTTTGDYRVFSDAGTPLNRSDDSWLTRRNNGLQQLDASARAGRSDRDGQGSTIFGTRVSWQDHGLPGLIAAPAFQASLATGFAMVDVDDRRQVASWSVRTRAYGTVEWQRFRDRDNEIGLAAQDREYLTLGSGASSSWKRLIASHQAQLGLEARIERFRDRDRWMESATLRGFRQTFSLSAGDELALGEWLLAAAVRLDLSRTDPATLPDTLMSPLPPRLEVSPSPRLTARLLAAQDLAVKASAGWYARQPTLVELFGDRGFIVGTPELKSETGPSLDLGVVWSPAKVRGPIDRSMLEISGFFNHSSNAIVFVNTGFVARPTNVGAAENLGLEVAATARWWQLLQLSANYTLGHSEQQESEPSFSGKDLPRHPRHAAYLKLEVARPILGRQVRCHGDLQWVSESYLDRANLQRVPARHMVGAGVNLELGFNTMVVVEVKNLLDHQVERAPVDPAPRPDLTSVPVAISDISGLPLPGRNVFVTLEWSR